ncbi:HAMP domain-containing sensor histidine kinase [uncultured Cohaesibacter sp.]|uniref:sensor histidine kinase n=1 Tax=uncultured Cohaesibacter sp. TaxID=1002546 RepID=UPI0029C7D433|nr:HAMP domain-containing sensor histidine kinase [uncultured Cohaesibacter sp.]
MHFGLTTRLLAIGSSLFVVLWIVLIVSFYWSGNGVDRQVNPEPQQLLALTNLANQLGREGRPMLEAATASARVSIQFHDEADQMRMDTDLLDDADMAIYREALGERLVRIQPNAILEGRPAARFFAGIAFPLEFWIRLDNGSLMVVEVKASFISTKSGVPAGIYAGLLGAILSAVAFFLLHREIRPLVMLAKAVERIDPGGDMVELPQFRSATPEVAALAGAFKRLQERLHTLARSRVALIGGIQHDIRSFATRLHLRIEKMPDEQDRQRATTDIRDMIELLDNALLTSRAEVGALNEELLDIGGLLRGELADFRQAGARVTLELLPAGDEILVLGDRLALRRVFVNILDNAIKYGGCAHVRVEQKADGVHVTIDDEGLGFSKEEGARSLLLEPFTRAEPSRARKTGGAGLGLAVAQALLEAHNGRITLAATPQGHGRVFICLPPLSDRIGPQES